MFACVDRHVDRAKSYESALNIAGKRICQLPFSKGVFCVPLMTIADRYCSDRELRDLPMLNILGIT